MRSKYCIILLILIMALLRYPLPANPVNVPVHHPVYNFLERMETLGIVHNLLDGVRPYSRAKVARFLQVVDINKLRLTPIDRRRLADYLLDFRYEIQPNKRNALVPEGQNWYSILAGVDNFKKDFVRFFRQKHPEEENHVFLWEDGGDNFYFDYIQNATYETRSNGDYRWANWQQYRFRGLFNHNFGYQWEVVLHRILGDEPYALGHPILKGSWSQQRADEPRYSDRTRGEISWNTGYVQLQFAQQEIEWGFGESGKLILSRDPEPYPYISISKEWGWGKFIALHGKLQSLAADTLENNLRLYPDKWVAAHRLEVSIKRRLTLGFSEHFIYGYRYADWAYLIPFNFYRAVQHKLRDRDNATIAIDFEWLAGFGSKIYGSVFLDEFRRSKLGTNWFGNKHAFLFGFYKTDPFGLANLNLRMEYAALMPWVYTHKYGINSYTTDGQSLGHWAGPNSELYYIHINKYWHQRLVTGIKWRQYKHGDNFADKNIGGDILLGHRSFDPQERQFLDGLLTTEQRLECYVHYELFNDLFLRGRYNYIDSNEPNIHRIYHEFYMGFEMRY
ncbi:MAG: hypothetical protein GF313_14130 [Caldithrix sp.]|nr:hypothetical protein [Caldithrix sp.]